VTETSLLAGFAGIIALDLFLLHSVLPFKRATLRLVVTAIPAVILSVLVCVFRTIDMETVAAKIIFFVAYLAITLFPPLRFVHLAMVRMRFGKGATSRYNALYWLVLLIGACLSSVYALSAIAVYAAYGGPRTD